MVLRILFYILILPDITGNKIAHFIYILKNDSFSFSFG